MVAVGSTILAMMADLTREETRTKSMAIAGITIGFSFSIAMFLGPILNTWLSVRELFFVSTLLGLAAITLVYFSVPTPQTSRWHRDTEPELSAFFKLLITPALAKLNTGIFILHAIFTASFIVIPISLLQFHHLNTHEQWEIYLPTLLIAFVLSLFCIGMAERKQQLKFYFLLGIMMIAVAQSLLWAAQTTTSFMTIGLGLFFTGFSLLEAFLPSLISRTAPATRKGTAMGLYSCSQFFGIFVGGVLGGWLYGKFSFTGVYLFCIALSFFWLILAATMQSPRYLVTKMLRLPSQQHTPWDDLSTKLQLIPGMVEVTFIADENMAYLKMERATTKNPDFLHLQEQLQSE